MVATAVGCERLLVAEVQIRLERPAALTPELRAWIGSRLGAGKAVLARARQAGGGPGELILRVEVALPTPEEVSDEVSDLITDLRLLGLRPTLLTDLSGLPTREHAAT